MKRREFFGLAAGCASAFALGRHLSAQTNSTPLHAIVDSHIHLFDPTRPSGVPWPEKTDTALYRPALPDRYEALAQPYGIVGCIAIEASPLATDNDWLLDVAHKHTVVLGVIGDLIPGSPSYLSDLDRLHRDPLFLGFRYGNLWDRDLTADLAKPGFFDGLNALAQAGLVFETANPDPSLIHAILNIAGRISGLRIVVDHLPNAALPTQADKVSQYHDDLHALAQHPHVFVKLSEIPVLRNGKLLRDSAFYRDRVDLLWNLFGEDRVIFGSDWPNSDHIASFSDTLSIVREYTSQKSPQALEKYYWKNSATAYRWSPRRSNQPHL
jgi:L-fuconolactonase